MWALMYLEKPRSFAETFQMPEFLEQERDQEMEQEMIKSFYPREALRIQEFVEQECDKLEYEGSVMYDEYLDKYRMEQLTSRICALVNEDGEEVQTAEKRGSRALVEVLLCTEIGRRRCRRRRCQRIF